MESKSPPSEKSVQEQLELTRCALGASIRALMSAVDAGDPFTRGLSYRISRCVIAMAGKLGVPRDQWEDLEYGALLHDIGRVALLHDVLVLPRALNSSERERMETHATIGYEIVRRIPLMEKAAEIVLTHHERPDGKGYPRGLRGDQIPLGARLVMVAAAYEGMTAERPYRRGLKPEQALAELRRHAGTQFFPEVVDAFVALLESGELFAGFDREEMQLFTRFTEDKAA